jgi:hypothetical protein
MHQTMARSTVAKAFGIRWGALADTTTWQPLPHAMLRLLVEIAEAEKRLDAERAKAATAAAYSEPRPGA